MSKLHIEIFGTGKPLVLVHGWAMHSGVWLGFAKQLAKNYKVILVDLPGHGRSEPVSPFTLPEISRVLAEAIVDENCSWLGWSLGAQVVLQLAADFPSRVDKLVLLNGSPCFVANGQWPGMAGQVLDKFANNLLTDCKGTLLRFLSLQVNGLENFKELSKQLRQIVEQANLPDQEALESGLAILKTADLRPTLANLDVPMLAILGELDTLVSRAVGVKLQQLQPVLQVHEILRAGHVPFLSHQNQVVELIQNFLKSNRAG